MKNLFIILAASFTILTIIVAYQYAVTQPIHRYANEDVERVYEKLSPEGRVRFDQAVKDLKEEWAKMNQSMKQKVAEDEQDIIANRQRIEAERAQVIPVINDPIIQKIEEETRQLRAKNESRDVISEPTPASIVVVDGPMTPEQIHTLMNGPK
jgi:predicted membrane protein